MAGVLRKRLLHSAVEPVGKSPRDFELRIELLRVMVSYDKVETAPMTVTGAE